MIPFRSRQQVPPEPEILRLCVCEPSDDNWNELRKLVTGAVDWPALASLTRAHGVSALIAPRIESLYAAGAVSSDAVSALRPDSLTATAHAMHMQAKLEALLKTAAAANIPLIVLKGSAIASMLYPKPLLRLSTDIDVLCKEEDYARLYDLLVAGGYSALDDRVLPGACSDLETSFEQHFHAPGTSVLIEVHVDGIKLGVKPVNSVSVWERAVPVQIGSCETLSLSPRDLALMLPVHLHRHGFSRFQWFKDIDLLLRKYGDELDWDQVVEDARREGATSSLWLTFSFLQTMLGTPVPDGLLARLKPGIFTRTAWKMVWPEHDIRSMKGTTRRRLVQFSVSESWRGTIPSLVLMGRRREKLQILFRRLTRRRATREAAAPGTTVSEPVSSSELAREDSGSTGRKVS